MESLDGYRLRLTTLSTLCLTGLAAIPLVLGYAIAGPEVAIGLVVAVGLLSFLGWPGRGPLPGTYPLGFETAPGLFTMVESLSRRAGLSRRPELRIIPGGQVNAAATLRGTTTVIIVTEALLERLDVRRLGAVLAHEMAHVANRDLTVFRLAQTLHTATLVLGLVTGILAVLTLSIDVQNGVFWALVALVAPTVARSLVALLSRTREFAADLGAARLTGDPEALAEALAIIEYRPRAWWGWLTGRRYPLPQDQAKDAFRTHPPTRQRIQRLRQLAWAAR